MNTIPVYIGLPFDNPPFEITEVELRELAMAPNAYWERDAMWCAQTITIHGVTLYITDESLRTMSR